MTDHARRVLSRSRAAALGTVLVGAVGAALLVRQCVHAATTPGIDFIHVWRAAHQLLRGSGAYADPLFTYPPGSALLLAPFGALSYRHAQLLMLAINAFAVLLAIWVVLVLLQRRVTTRSVAVGLLALGVADAVGSTWANGNVNGTIVLLEAAALLGIQRSRWTTSAVLMGVSLTIKPVLLPLLFLFVARRQWRPLLIATGIPLGATGIGWIVIPDSHRFTDVVVPFLMHGAQLSFNDSIVGVGHLLSWPSYAVIALRVFLTIATCSLMGSQLRAVQRARTTDLCLLAGLLLAATFLIAPMSETYYTIYLAPAFAAWALTSARSAAAATLTVAACFATFRLPGDAGSGGGISIPLALRPSVGWAICLLVFSTAPRWSAPRHPRATWWKTVRHDPVLHTVDVGAALGVRVVGCPPATADLEPRRHCGRGW